MADGPRVVDVTQWYSPTSGGIRTYLHAKAEWAASTGAFHAAVLTGPRDGVSTVAGSPAVLVRGRTPRATWGYRVALRARGVLAAVERLRPDVIVVHDALAFPRSLAEWASDAGVRVVQVCHSHLADAVRGAPRIVRRPAGAALTVIQRRALTVGEVVLVASPVVREAIRGGAPGPDVVVSPLGIDLDTFRRATPDPELRRCLGVPDGAPLLLYAGRLSREKAVDLLPGVVRGVEDGVLVVAGTGAARTRLEQQCRRAGVGARVRWMGHVSDRDQMASLMATADCFVHPNAREPFGLALLEALAAGCRLVAPRSIGIADIVGGRGAVLVDPHDPDALAAGVATALGRPRPRPDLDDLSWNAVFRREWTLYRSLVNQTA